MKKIILSVFTILAVCAVTFGATQALFSDKESITGNTFTAGSLDLTLTNPVSLPFVVTDVKPGDEGQGKVTLTNSGSIAGNLGLSVINMVQAENGCLEPEIEAGDPCDAGDLGLALSMAMFLDLNKNGVYDGTDIELEGSGNTNTTAGLNFYRMTDFVGKDWSDDLLTDLLGGMTASNPLDLVVLWKFPHDAYPKADAIYMTDSLSFDMEFVLTQVN